MRIEHNTERIQESQKAIEKLQNDLRCEIRQLQVTMTETKEAVIRIDGRGQHGPQKGTP